MKSQMLPPLKSIPPIVQIVITQATRRRAEGGITEDKYDAQILRLAREELEPKGFNLQMRNLGSGRRRFVIKETATGIVCDMLDFASDGTPEVETGDVQPYAPASR